MAARAALNDMDQTDDPIIDVQWWLSVPEAGMVLWARLSERAEGAADVLDSTGMTMRFPSRGDATHFLLDLEYRAHDGLDEDDAEGWGLVLADLVPPSLPDGPALVAAMNQRTGKSP
jgi:hypothetical protein